MPYIRHKIITIISLYKAMSKYPDARATICSGTKIFVLFLNGRGRSRLDRKILEFDSMQEFKEWRGRNKYHEKPQEGL